MLWVDWSLMGFGWNEDLVVFGVDWGSNRFLVPRMDLDLMDFRWIGTLWVSANLTAAQAPLECPITIVLSSTPNSSFMNGNQMELKHCC